MDYLRLSVTDRCNLRCQYCMPASGIEKLCHSALLRNEDYLKIVAVMAKLGVKKVRLTGGEPLVRKGLPHLIKQIYAIDGIEEVTLTTNGILLEQQLDGLVEAGIKRLNISLDSLNPLTYSELTRGGNLECVLRGIQKARDKGITPIKINVVLIKGVNTSEIDDFISLVDPFTEVRFIELMPIGEASNWSKDKFIDIDSLFKTRTDLRLEPLKGNGGPCRYYKPDGINGYIGVINPISDHFCDKCNRLRVTSEGILKTCLHDDTEFDLRPYLSSSQKLEETILSAVQLKQKEHQLNSFSYQPIKRSMHTIGG